MFESYLGPEKFAQGIQLHLKRYAHGNANADDFFRSLGEARGIRRSSPRCARSRTRPVCRW